MTIDHVELIVPDRHEAAEWYGAVFGMSIVPEVAHWAADEGGPLMISGDRGQTKLALFTGEPPGFQRPVGFMRVAFRTDAERFAELVMHGAARTLFDNDGEPLSTLRPVDHGVAWSLYFRDPWGYRYEITTYDYDEVAALAR